MVEEFSGEAEFCERLYAFMAARGTPIGKIPVFDHKELDLYRLYKGVVSRGGLETVIENKLWRAITQDLDFDPDRTDAGFRLRLHYLRLLYAFERVQFLKLEDNVNLEFEHQFAKCPKTKEKGGLRKMPPRTKRPSISSLNSSPLANDSPSPTSTPNGKDIPSSSENKGSPPIQIVQSTSKSTREVSVNFRVLDLMSLKKYKQYHRIKITRDSNKKELAEAVTLHFVHQSIDDEDAVINSFVEHVKCDREAQRRELRRRNAARLRYYDE